MKATFATVPKVSLTADGWTGPFQKDFLGVTAHWIDDKWIQKELVIGFEPMNGSHTGENLAEALINVAERFNIGEKVQSITTDNALNMSRMVNEFVKHEKAVDWYVCFYYFFARWKGALSLTFCPLVYIKLGDSKITCIMCLASVTSLTWQFKRFWVLAV